MDDKIPVAGEKNDINDKMKPNLNCFPVDTVPKLKFFHFLTGWHTIRLPLRTPPAKAGQHWTSFSLNQKFHTYG